MEPELVPTVGSAVGHHEQDPIVAEASQNEPERTAGPPFLQTLTAAAACNEALHLRASAAAQTTFEGVPFNWWWKWNHGEDLDEEVTRRQRQIPPQVHKEVLRAMHMQTLPRGKRNRSQTIISWSPGPNATPLQTPSPEEVRLGPLHEAFGPQITYPMSQLTPQDINLRKNDPWSDLLS